MSAPGGSGRWVRWGLPLVAALAVMIGVLAPARSASAHPLDQYLQISYITVDPTQITVEIAFTPGVLLAPDALPKIDSNVTKLSTHVLRLMAAISSSQR